MSKYAVVVSRSAYINVVYSIEADSGEDAEEKAQNIIDTKGLSALGDPIEETYTDDEESCWEVVDSHEAR